ncbi:hypothetical protein GJ744_000131 [Endocarpon pusillum]|uniref:FAD dependent oxidoreductase domain-containing protein n=1 Tax=Endocarpon pusillum TaxID=364733 RepID=A0A8H7EC29_9EURO|nr:hypothetical protein GJ744_000131 [Endocarpon pusillum]
MPPSAASQEKRNIVIVGGGIIGSTTAYFLTRHPSYNPSLHSIHLIEAASIASGASGKAGGLLALWAYPSSIVPLSFRLHEALAKEHGGEKRWGYRGVSCGQLDIKGRRLGDATAGGKGNPNVVNPVHDEAKERISLKKRSNDSYQALQAAGVPDDLDWLVDSNIQSYDSMGTPENTAQVHPYQFTTSMAQLAQEKGAEIILGSVKSINYKDNDNAVESITYIAKNTNTSTTVPATDIILTLGPWTQSLLPHAPISALRAHSITIRPSRPCSAYAIFTSITLPPQFRPGGKNKRPQHVSPEIYARPNNELYACGEGDTLVPLPPTSAEVAVDESRCQDIADYCSAISDELRDGEILTRQACYLPQVESRAGSGPLIGKTSTKGLFLAAGHTCWGIQNGPGTGKLMSEFVFDGKAGSARVEGAGLDPRNYGL